MLVPRPSRQVQFLDQETLLISLGTPDTTSSRSAESSQAKSFFVIYKLPSCSVTAFLASTSDSFAALCRQCHACFLAGSITCQWDRCVSCLLTEPYLCQSFC